MGKEEIDNMGDIRQTIKAKKWNMILGVLDICMMMIASYLALLTRFEFYPSKVAPVFFKYCVAIYAFKSFLQYHDIYGIQTLFYPMEICRNIRFY